jgi:hypothetical protein
MAKPGCCRIFAPRLGCKAQYLRRSFDVNHYSLRGRYVAYALPRSPRAGPLAGVLGQYLRRSFDVNHYSLRGRYVAYALPRSPQAGPLAGVLRQYLRRSFDQKYRKTAPQVGARNAVKRYAATLGNTTRLRPSRLA